MSRLRLLLPILCVLPLVAARAQERTTLPLSDGWRFHLGGDFSTAGGKDLDDSGWQQVSVPHSWNRVGYYLDPAMAEHNRADTIELTQGVGWYRLAFQTPVDAKRRYWLQFDAASRTAEVWLNGVRVGAHQGGFSRFRFDVTDTLKPGANLLTVKVDNSVPAAGNGTADSLPLAGDFFVHGGLYRGVSLIATRDSFFEMMDFGGPGLYATTQDLSPERAHIAVSAKLRHMGNDAFKGRLVLRLLDAKGKEAAKSAAPLSFPANQTVTQNLSLEFAKPHLWQGVADPYLYRLEARLEDVHGALLDQVTQPYGLRTIKIDPDKGLFLNGRHLFLHGVSRHQDRDGKGWGVSAADEDEDFAIIGELGANTVRLAHYQQSEHVNEIADRMGLILWDEIPLVSKWTLTPDQERESTGLAANARQQLTELIRQNFNHPAVAVWGIANEVDFGVPVTTNFDIANDGKAPDPRPLLQELNALARQEDPSRPSTLATCCEATKSERPNSRPPMVSGLTEVVGANRYYGWYYGAAEDFAERYDYLHAAHPDLPMAVSEYGAGGALTQQTDDPLGGPITSHARIQPEDYQSHVHEVTWPLIAERPYLWASWVWNMFDFATTVRREGDSTDLNTKGLVTYDRKTRKDAFYYFQANWSASPVVHIAGRRYVDRAYRVTDVKVFSNASSTSLSLNGRDLGVQGPCPYKVCVWRNVALDQGDNHLEAHGKDVADAVDWRLAPAARDHLWIASGSILGRTTTEGRFGSDHFFQGGTGETSYRRGRFSYDLPAEPGRYRLTLSFAVPEAKEPRRFGVTGNGKELLTDFTASEASRQFEIDIPAGGLHLDFVPTQGEAVVSAIQLDRL